MADRAINWRASFGNEAERVLDEFERHEVLSIFPDLRRIVVENRYRLMSVFSEQFDIPPISGVMDELENFAVPFLDCAEVSVKDEVEKSWIILKDLIAQTRLKLEFLRDFCVFQERSYQRSDKVVDSQRFGIAPSNKFLQEYPEYSQFTGGFPRLLSNLFRCSVVELLSRMKFPVIVDREDVAEMRKKISEDLWEIYNEKNGFPPVNRKYRINSQLPVIKESFYDNDIYEKAFGGFINAVDVVILKTKKGSESKVEEVDPKLKKSVLMRSFKLGRIPSAEELGIPIEDFNKLVEQIKESLRQEIQDIVKKFTTIVERKPGVFAYCFNWFHLLINSESYSEFGIKIFETWLGKNELEVLSRHRNKSVAYVLRRALLGDTNLEHMRRMPDYFETDVDPSGLDNMSRSELIELAERKFLGKKFANSRRVSPQILRDVMKIYIENHITVRPCQSHFVEFRKQNVKDTLQILVEKSQFFDEHPEIPVYMRQVIYCMRLSSVEDIEKRRGAFIAAGLDPRYYVHFLHLDNAYVPRRIHALQRGVKHEEEVNLRCQEVVDSSVVPTTPERKVRKPNLREKEVSSGMTEEEAIDALGARGYPYEDFSQIVRTVFKASTVYRKVCLMLSEMGQVKVSLLRGCSDDRIRRIAAELKDKEQLDEEREEELEAFIVERGLTNPPAYLKRNRITAGHILRVIKEIEDRGVPFRSEYWWWINASNQSRDDQIEHTWLKVSKDRRFKDLGEIYGFNPEELPKALLRKDPDHLYEYLRLIASSGHNFRDFLWMTNQNGLKAFRTKLIEKVKRKVNNGKQELSEGELQYIFRYECTMVAINKVGENFEGYSVFELFDCATRDELHEFARNPNGNLEGTMNTLRQRASLFEDVKRRLQRARLGYGLMNRTCESEETARCCLDRLILLEKAGLDITEESLLAETVLVESDLLVTRDAQKINMYLNNLGCSAGVIDRIMRTDLTLEEIKKRVKIFTSVSLDEEEFGKTGLDISDYEDYLTKSLRFCTSFAVRQIKRKLSNCTARVKLHEALGLIWDHDQGWVIKRTSPVTMLQKHRLVKGHESLCLAEDQSQLVLRYSGYSLRDMIEIADQLKEVCAGITKNDQKADYYVRLGLSILYGIARLSTNAVIGSVLIAKAKEILFTGKFAELIGKLNRSKKSGLPDVEKITSAEVLDIYRQIVDSFKGEEKFTGDLLTREEEVELGRRFTEEGDKKAREILITKNLRLVMSIAKRYLWSNIPFEDLVQEGNIGLMATVDKWDYKKGFKFSTYASWWIRQRIGRYVRDNSRVIRIPVHIQDTLKSFNAYIESFYDEKGREPTAEELAKALNISKIIAAGYLRGNWFKREAYLDESLHPDEDGSATRLDMIGEDDCGYDSMERIRSRRSLLSKFKIEFFQKYPHRNKELAWDVFINRFGFTEDEESMTLEELGDKHSFTRERIRQIEASVLDFIRKRPEIIEELKAFID